MRNLRDPIEAEHLEQVVRSAGYSVVTERLRDIIEVKRTELEQSLSEAKTAELRGEIRGLRLALELPRILRDEFQVAVARKK